MLYHQFPPHFVVKDGIHGAGVFVVADFKKGSVLFKMKGDIVQYPTRTSVQLGKNKHIEDRIAGHVNHSCTPNAKIDRKTQSFVCLRDIEKGEEIMFDYNSNEELLASPFTCECCGRLIAGKKMSFPTKFKKPITGKRKTKLPSTETD